MKGLATSAVLISLIKSIYKLINVILTIIARILILFGLWVPLIYSFAGVLTMLAFKVNPLAGGTYSYIFFVGLVLSLLISGIITVKTMLIRPIKELLDYRAVQKEYDRRKEDARRLDLYHKNPKKYFATYGELPDKESTYYLKSKRTRDEITRIDEIPKIYRSEANRDIVIHEYKDRFEVYKDMGDSMVHIDTKPR